MLNTLGHEEVVGHGRQHYFLVILFSAFVQLLGVIINASSSCHNMIRPTPMGPISIFFWGLFGAHLGPF